jgi:sorbitol-6-phosphate 2-dehydrogenase
MNIKSSLKNNVIIVTGGGGGLGRAICAYLAEMECRIVAADIDLEKARETVQQLPGESHLALPVDISDEFQVAEMVDSTVEHFGQLDVLVANAGILISGATTSFPAEKWKKVLMVNLYGYFLCAKHAARVMIPRSTGVILQINSKSGKVGSYKNSAYAASKFGGIGLTQSLALELAEHHIRVNAICPGNLLDSPLWTDSLYGQYAKKLGVSEDEVRKIYTEKVPLGRGCTYEDVCGMVAYLASAQAEYITGQSINITGGQVMH